MASNTFFGTRSIVGNATATSIDSRIRGAPSGSQAVAYAGSGIGCALNFTCDGDVYVGTDSSVTDAGGGALLPAGIPFTDYATGRFGNICDITQLYVFAVGNVALTVYFRGM